MARRHGRCMRGERLRISVPHGHWKTTTFIGALTLRGFIAPFVIDRPINRIAFETYVEKVLLPELHAGDIVVMDNLSSHKGPRVREMIESVGARLEYLPPYSRISTLSKTPSQSSRHCCERPPNDPLKVSGSPSAACSSSSRQTNARTISQQPDTMQRDRILL